MAALRLIALNWCITIPLFRPFDELLEFIAYGFKPIWSELKLLFAILQSFGSMDR
jgi:hypothetical protein